jgi:nitrogen regulatory protein P-II 1
MRLMKRIEAIIRSEKMQDVKQGLVDSGHAEMTLYQAQGHSTDKGIVSRWRGQEYTVDLLPEVAVVLMVDDQEVPAIVEVIRQNARTNRTGDGKIFVTSVEQVISMCGGETRDEAP